MSLGVDGWEFLKIFMRKGFEDLTVLKVLSFLYKIVGSQIEN